jgi:hypothetical protein
VLEIPIQLLFLDSRLHQIGLKRGNGAIERFLSKIGLPDVVLKSIDLFFVLGLQLLVVSDGVIELCDL